MLLEERKDGGVVLVIKRCDYEDENLDNLAARFAGKLKMYASRITECGEVEHFAKLEVVEELAQVETNKINNKRNNIQSNKLNKSKQQREDIFQVKEVYRNQKSKRITEILQRIENKDNEKEMKIKNKILKPIYNQKTTNQYIKKSISSEIISNIEIKETQSTSQFYLEKITKRDLMSLTKADKNKISKAGLNINANPWVQSNTKITSSKQNNKYEVLQIPSKSNEMSQTDTKKSLIGETVTQTNTIGQYIDYSEKQMTDYENNEPIDINANLKKSNKTTNMLPGIEVVFVNKDHYKKAMGDQFYQPKVVPVMKRLPGCSYIPPALRDQFTLNVRLLFTLDPEEYRINDSQQSDNVNNCNNRNAYGDHINLLTHAVYVLIDEQQFSDYIHNTDTKRYSGDIINNIYDSCDYSDTNSDNNNYNNNNNNNDNVDSNTNNIINCKSDSNSNNRSNNNNNGNINNSNIDDNCNNSNNNINNKSSSESNTNNSNENRKNNDSNSNNRNNNNSNGNKSNDDNNDNENRENMYANSNKKNRNNKDNQNRDRENRDDNYDADDEDNIDEEKLAILRCEFDTKDCPEKKKGFVINVDVSGPLVVSAETTRKENLQVSGVDASISRQFIIHQPYQEVSEDGYSDNQESDSEACAKHHYEIHSDTECNVHSDTNASNNNNANANNNERANKHMALNRIREYNKKNQEGKRFGWNWGEDCYTSDSDADEHAMATIELDGTRETAEALYNSIVVNDETDLGVSNNVPNTECDHTRDDFQYPERHDTRQFPQSYQAAYPTIKYSDQAFVNTRAIYSEALRVRRVAKKSARNNDKYNLLSGRRGINELKKMFQYLRSYCENLPWSAQQIPPDTTDRLQDLLNMTHMRDYIVSNSSTPNRSSIYDIAIAESGYQPPINIPVSLSDLRQLNESPANLQSGLERQMGNWYRNRARHPAIAVFQRLHERAVSVNLQAMSERRELRRNVLLKARFVPGAQRHNTYASALTTTALAHDAYVDVLSRRARYCQRPKKFRSYGFMLPGYAFTLKVIDSEIESESHELSTQAEYDEDVAEPRKFVPRSESRKSEPPVELQAESAAELVSEIEDAISMKPDIRRIKRAFYMTYKNFGIYRIRSMKWSIHFGLLKSRLERRRQKIAMDLLNYEDTKKSGITIKGYSISQNKKYTTTTHQMKDGPQKTIVLNSTNKQVSRYGILMEERKQDWERGFKLIDERLCNKVETTCTKQNMKYQNLTNKLVDYPKYNDLKKIGTKKLNLKIEHLYNQFKYSNAKKILDEIITESIFMSTRVSFKPYQSKIDDNIIIEDKKITMINISNQSPNITQNTTNKIDNTSDQISNSNRLYSTQENNPGIEINTSPNIVQNKNNKNDNILDQTSNSSIISIKQNNNDIITNTSKNFQQSIDSRRNDNFTIFKPNNLGYGNHFPGPRNNGNINEMQGTLTNQYTRGRNIDKDEGNTQLKNIIIHNDNTTNSGIHVDNVIKNKLKNKNIIKNKVTIENNTLSNSKYRHNASLNVETKHSTGNVGYKGNKRGNDQKSVSLQITKDAGYNMKMTYASKLAQSKPIHIPTMTEHNLQSQIRKQYNTYVADTKISSNEKKPVVSLVKQDNKMTLIKEQSKISIKNGTVTKSTVNTNNCYDNKNIKSYKLLQQNLNITHKEITKETFKQEVCKNNKNKKLYNIKIANTNSIQPINKKQYIHELRNNKNNVNNLKVMKKNNLKRSEAKSSRYINVGKPIENFKTKQHEDKITSSNISINNKCQDKNIKTTSKLINQNFCEKIKKDKLEKANKPDEILGNTLCDMEFKQQKGRKRIENQKLIKITNENIIKKQSQVTKVSNIFHVLTPMVEINESENNETKKKSKKKLKKNNKKVNELISKEENISTTYSKIKVQNINAIPPLQFDNLFIKENEENDFKFEVKSIKYLKKMKFNFMSRTFNNKAKNKCLNRIFNFKAVLPNDNIEEQFKVNQLKKNKRVQFITTKLKIFRRIKLGE